MSSFKLTPDQEKAVVTRGKPILVSAAAGSGKTRVLTERLIARVQEGEDINRFLVITFTKAAAAELRSRILTELNALLAENPMDQRLRRQSALLYRAKIGTIHSFCGDLVRENAHMLGISPSFAVATEEKCAQMQQKALDDVLEAAYEGIEENPGLRLLVDSVGAGRDDSRLAGLILSLNKQMKCHAFPEAWLAEQLSQLDMTGIEDAGQTPWGAWLLADAKAEAEYWAAELEQALVFMNQDGMQWLMKGYGAGVSDLAEWFRDIARACDMDWDRVQNVLAKPYPGIGRIAKAPDATVKDYVKNIFDSAKKQGGDKIKKRLIGDSESLLRGMTQSRPAIEALMHLVMGMERRYTERKRRANVCDFSDLEHMCVQLLCDGAGGAKPLAQTVSARFAEVMVDEYQDVNAVQEMIFQRVSDEGKRLFMVGDVKQSIYRFRLAEPQIFNSKYAEFASGTHGERVLLRENFRSRGSVLAACNSVFERIMSPALGDIEYDDEARLVAGAVYPEEGEIKPELHVLVANRESDSDEAPDKLQLEAEYVARNIQRMVLTGEQVSDGIGGMRPVAYGDIAILMRAGSSSMAAFRNALAERGVPVNAQKGAAFLRQPEVSFALSMLTVADNPHQDVPLIAALRGMPFAFQPAELAAIRAGEKGDFWDALVKRAEEDEHCARFVAVLSQLRELAREEPVDALLRWLYDETGLLSLCGTMPDGVQRSANLMQLYDLAQSYEKESGGGLFGFMAWMRQMQKSGREPELPSAGGGVSIMTIHKSKGLEFPVVFLVNLSHRMGGASEKEHVLCHSRLGLGMRMTDAQRGVRWPTLAWRAIDAYTALEGMSEEERVLYVAMTRARERLIMTCVERKPPQDAQPGTEAISPRELMKAKSMADWLIRVARADAGQTMDMSVVAVPVVYDEADEVEAEAQEPDAAEAEAVSELAAVFHERLAGHYPHAAAVTLPSKITATAARTLSRDEIDHEAMSLVDPAEPDADEAEGEGQKRPVRMPDFGGQQRGMTGAERGIATHLVMQHIDIAKTDTIEDIRNEIDRLCRQGFMDERQAQAVAAGDILAFFRSSLGERLKNADHVEREFQFSLLTPAGMWDSNMPEDETVLLQGVVDCCIEEQGELTIIDFKTDGVIEPEKYTPQLRAYAYAMERIMEKPVREMILWYVRKRTMAAVN